MFLTHLLEVGIGVAPFRQHCVVPLEQRCCFPEPIHHIAHDVFGLVEVWFLLKQANSESGGQPGFAGKAVVEASHDLVQRRLTRAIRTDDTDLGPWVEREADVFQDLSVRRIEPAHLVHGENELCTHGGQG